MIRDVDRSEVIGSNLIQSPVLGAISPVQLSGGVKTLILIYKVRDAVKEKGDFMGIMDSDAVRLEEIKKRIRIKKEEMRKKNNYRIPPILVAFNPNWDFLPADEADKILIEEPQSPEEAEQYVRELKASGARNVTMFVTDDDFPEELTWDYILPRRVDTGSRKILS